MATGDMKADPRRMIRAHFRTLVSANTGRTLIADHVVLELVPAGLGFAYLASGKFLLSVTSAGLVTVTGLLGAFLFALMIQIADRAESWADTHPTPGPQTSRHAIYLTELSANAGYASLVSIVASVVFVMCSATTGLPRRVSGAAGLGLGLHLVLTLFMVLKRVFALTEERLLRARTGASP